MARALPPGIHKHPLGYRVFVRLFNGPGGLKSKVFPPGAGLMEMRRWREDQRQQPRRRPAPVTGFAADAKAYLAAVKGMSSYADRARDILRWVDVFGDTPRKDITSTDIRTQLARWGLTKAASTVNHRRTALMHMYRVLDGPDAANPVRDIPKWREPEPGPRGVSYAVIEAIFSHMPDTKTLARLRVIAYTGIPHASLGRIKPEHVSLEQRSVYVPGRLKGAGTQGRRVPLTDAGVEAFKAFLSHDAFGTFSRHSARKSFVLARNKADGDGCLRSMRVYDLRHSFGTALYAASGDIRATQILMGHASLAMTHRYTLGAVDGRVSEALAKLDQV